MIPGIVAGQMRLGGTAEAVRPEMAGFATGAGNNASFAVPLPSGWLPGQLAVLAVNSSTGGGLGLTGWNEASIVSNGNVYARVLWRVLQVGDEAQVIIAGGYRAAICITFAVGTFASELPVSMLSAAVGSSSSSLTAPLSAYNHPAGQHYKLQFGYTRGFALGVSSYPFAEANALRGTGSSPTFNYVISSGGPFDGGLDPGSTIQVFNDPTWVTRKIAIAGHPG
ncbi:hypothetical protein D3C78_618960 [compost metagenome]